MPTKRKNIPNGGKCDPIRDVRAIAMQYPEAEEGIACKGTALECTVFKARKKAFAFVSNSHLRLKLKELLTEANRLAKQDSSLYEVGSLGWVKINFCADGTLPLEIVKRWIDESYRIIVDKRLVAMLPDSGKSLSIRKIGKKSP